MPPSPSQDSLKPSAARLLRWWDRIGIGVRCAYNPRCPCAVRRYIAAGRHVAQAGAMREPAVMKRMLTVLLQTALDPALPRHWREVCLQYTTFPLARALSLLQDEDPIACEAMAGAVQAAGDVLENSGRAA